MSALPARERPSPGWHAEAEWAQIEASAPQVAAVMRRYLRQLGTFLAPRSVDAADGALRQLARWMVTEAGLTAARCASVIIQRASWRSALSAASTLRGAKNAPSCRR